jgi:hypothetical protein
MRVFTATELGRMRDTQDSAMQDTCWILRYRSITDSYGNPKATYPTRDESVCGLELVDPAEEQDTGDVPVIDARLRLPIETVLDTRDQILITHRYGEELAEADQLTFEMEGPAERGPSGLVLKLRLVDDA